MGKELQSADNGKQFVAYEEQDPNSYVETDADSTGTYDVFYDRLAPEGRWLYNDDYGYVWKPNAEESSSNWRPYADGHWVWTDRGWYWDSNEDFGWATYITNITHRNDVVYKNGPQYQHLSQSVQREFGQQVPNDKINYSAQTRPNAAFKAVAEGKQLN